MRRLVAENTITDFANNYSDVILERQRPGGQFNLMQNVPKYCTFKHSVITR